MYFLLSCFNDSIDGFFRTFLASSLVAVATVFLTSCLDDFNGYSEFTHSVEVKPEGQHDISIPEDDDYEENEMLRELLSL